MVRKQPVKIIGGYVGEKEIKSAGNKIYKLIHSPEAQDLGKVALTSLIALAIGSTIKKGTSSSQVEVPPAGAPPAIERQPDIYDTNPLLHFTGLGLKRPAIKSVGGYVGEKEIKSAGNKIYKLIQSPEAQDLGKVALTSLIALAIGSTIKNSTSSRPVEAPPVVAPPPTIERQPDIYDTNPLLHFTGLGLKRPAIKSVSDKIHNFIKSPEAKALSPAKLKAQIIRHLSGGGIFDNIKETAATVKRKAKQAGESIYKAITSKEAQMLGAAGLALLITGILGKYAYDRRLPIKQNNRLTLTVDEDDDTPALTRPEKSNLNQLADNLYQLQDDRHARLARSEKLKTFYDPNESSKDIADNLIDDLQDVADKIKRGEPVDGGLGLKKKSAIKSASEKIHNFIKSPEAKSMTKTKLKNRITKHLQGCGIKQNLKSAGDSIYKIATSPTAQNLGKVALTLLFAKAVEKAIPVAYEAKEAHDKNIADKIQMDKAIERAKNFVAEYDKNENKSLLSGNTNFRADGLIPKPVNDTIERVANSITDSILYLKKQAIDKRYLLFLIASMLAIGVGDVAIKIASKGKKPYLYHDNMDELERGSVMHGYTATNTRSAGLKAKGGNVEEEKEEKKEQQTFYNKYIKPASDTIYEILVSNEGRYVIKETIVALMKLYLSKTPLTVDLSKLIFKEKAAGLMNKGGKYSAGDLKDIKKMASDKVASIKSQLNKIYKDITSEKGKKITQATLLTVAGLLSLYYLSGEKDSAKEMDDKMLKYAYEDYSQYDWPNAKKNVKDAVEKALKNKDDGHIYTDMDDYV